MRYLRNILTIIVIGSPFQLFGQGIGKDSLFTFEDTTFDGRVQPFLVDNRTYSPYYNDISNFNFSSSWDVESYKHSTDWLQQQNHEFIKKKPLVPWLKWVPLNLYKGKFYVYRPCDFYNHFNQSINDTSFIDWTVEGPAANKIVEQKKIDTITFEYELIGIYSQQRKVVIHMIDTENGIAVFEEISDETENFFYLMIAADKIKNVPIIVNHCPTQKQLELLFEEPNFQTLLNNK